MKTVSVKAENLRTGDVLKGARIVEKMRFIRRNCGLGIMVVTPHPKGYDLITHKFTGDERVLVKRPKCNMR